MTSTFSETLSRDVSHLTKEDILQTVEHALQVARECPHRANGGAAIDHLSSDDLTDADKPNVRGRQRLDLWTSVFFAVVSRESYNSHQPG